MLPEKLSDLLYLAVKDAQACEAQPEKFRLRMGDWFYPDPDGGPCAICMAGAVMAKTLGLSTDKERFPEGELAGPLFAVDSMRVGDFTLAAGELRLDIPSWQTEALTRIGNAVYGQVDTLSLCRAEWPVYLDAVTELRKVGL